MFILPRSILLNFTEHLFFREISWKEFVNQHLSRGSVSKLEVINNKWVKVSSYYSKMFK